MLTSLEYITCGTIAMSSSLSFSISTEMCIYVKIIQIKKMLLSVCYVLTLKHSFFSHELNFISWSLSVCLKVVEDGWINGWWALLNVSVDF